LISFLILGAYCERSVNCNDMSACQLNFLSTVSCIANISIMSMQSSKAPYQCINDITNSPCSNASECCKQGYAFQTDVQQCLCKIEIIQCKMKQIFFLFY
jgi:hypothetical protein